MRECQTCSALKQKVANLEADLAAWDDYGSKSVNTRDLDVSRWLGLTSHQAAKILLALLGSPGATIPYPVLAEHAGYDRDRSREFVRVLICRIRNALTERGLPTVQTKWGHGYTIDRKDAAVIRSAMENARCGG